MNALILRPAKPNLRVRWMPGQRRGNAVARKNLGLNPFVGAVLGAPTISLLQYVVKITAGPRIAVTILHLTRDPGGPIGLGVTQTRSTGRKDLHQEHSGADSVGKQSIAMTTTVPGAAALKIRCKLK